MTQGWWKKLFIVVTVLLVACIILGGSLWQQLNTTKIQLNDTEMQLDDTKAQLSAVKPEMDRLKAEQARMQAEQVRMFSGYANLKKQIELRLGIRQDGQCFITPDDPEISATVQEITGGYSEDANEFWRDQARLFRWVIQNIEYSADSPIPLLPESIDGTLGWEKDFWRMPVETIRHGAGDCEDMALLLASMLLNYTHREFTVWIVGIQTFGSTPKGHIAVALPIENNQLTIFDPATRYCTPFLTIAGLGSQEVTLAVNDWLTRLEKEMPGAQIYVVFSEDIYQEFPTTQEFIDWVYQF